LLSDLGKGCQELTFLSGMPSTQTLVPQLQLMPLQLHRQLCVRSFVEGTGRDY
jgi:hypothetical protein